MGDNNFQLYIALLTVMVIATTQGYQGCDDSWFGSERQYQCHCQDNKCNNSGACKNGSYCQVGWFGPECQYVDLVASGSIKTIPESSFKQKLNNEACLGNSSRETLTVSLDFSYPFSWMRIQTDSLDSVNTLKIQFKSGENPELENCPDQAMFIVTNNTVDIRCHMNVSVKQVILKGSAVGSICSVHISGGRNIAVKQQTVQQGGIYPMLRSSKAVDGDTSQDRTEENCLIFEHQSSLAIILTQPHVINRYRILTSNNILNNTQCCPADFQYFKLEAFSSNHTKVSVYNDTTKKNQLVYSILPGPTNQQVSGIIITSMSPVAVLTVCEVQIFAENNCEKGLFGLECSNSCSCPGCLAATGACPASCLGNGCDIKVSPTDTTDWTLVIALIASLAVVLLAVVVIVSAVCYRRRRKSQSMQEQPLYDTTSSVRQNEHPYAQASHLDASNYYLELIRGSSASTAKVDISCSKGAAVYMNHADNSPDHITQDNGEEKENVYENTFPPTSEHDGNEDQYMNLKF